MMNIKKYSLLLLMCIQTAGLSALKVGAAPFRRGTSPRSTVVQKPTAEQIAAYRQYMAAQAQDGKQGWLSKLRVPRIVQQVVLGTVQASVSTLAMMAMKSLVEKGASSAMSSMGFGSKNTGMPEGLTLQEQKQFMQADYSHRLQLLAYPSRPTMGETVKSVVQSTAIGLISQVALGTLKQGIFG
jgi:hypothetical protein